MTDARQRRLLIPANRPPSREVLLTVMPFFLRDRTQAPPESAPPLLSFASDTFVDDFLAVAGGARALPRLLPWRDWSEPPDAMLDPSGAADYPATVGRGAPLAFEPEAGAGMDPDGIPAGAPPWLRKLYLPLHERFTMVAFDVVCRAAGWPRLARARVLGAGAVIRRLVPDAAGERWQDWVAVDEKHGVWLEMLDAAMRPAPGDPPADPAGVPAAALVPHEAGLRRLFDVPAASPLAEIPLTGATLSLIPPDTGSAADHCTLFGYLPVFSAAQEVVTDRLAERPVAEIAAALSADTQASLSALFAGTPGMRAGAAPHLGTILHDALLPDRPGVAAVAAALDSVRTFPGSIHPVPAQRDDAIAAAVDRALRQALRRLLDRDGSAIVRDAQIAGDVPTGQELWIGADAHQAAREPGSGAGWVRDNMLALTPHWDALVRERMHRITDAWLAGGAVPAPAAGASSVLGARDLWVVAMLGVLRLRGCRMALAANLSVAAGWGDAGERLREVDADGSPVYTAAGLGEEIEAVLSLEAGRGDPRAEPPWPPIVFTGLADPSRILGVHRAGIALAAVYAGLDAGLSGAGGAAGLQVTARARTVADNIATVLALPSGFAPLRERGVDLLEQPARGLLVVPGYQADAAALSNFANGASARYLAQPRELALTEARGRQSVPRLRFDADHVYAVWCWVRVAGRDPCEPQRVLWTPRSEPFSIADPTDLLGARPASIRMPDIPKLLRDLPRIPRARARPFAAVAAGDRSGISVGEEMADTRRDWGIGFICSFGIPVVTICALILFNIIFHILITLPGFAWMLLLKFCIPFPRRGS